MKTLNDRLTDKNLENTVTTAIDYGILLGILSHKLNKPIDELREGKGRWTYKQWRDELNKNK